MAKKKQPVVSKKNIADIVSVHLQCTKKDASVYVDAVLDAIIQSLLDGNRIQIRDFINLTIKEKPAVPSKPFRHPGTGEMLKTKPKPASKVMKMTVSKLFKQRIS